MANENQFVHEGEELAKVKKVNPTFFVAGKKKSARADKTQNEG